MVIAALLSSLLLAPAGSASLQAPLQTSLQASPAVEGVVRSSEGERVLAYARVQVVDDTVADWTDERGAYRLEGLKRGEWRLRVAHPGHDSLDLTVSVPGDRVVRIDVTLNAVPGPVVEPLADFEPFRMEYTLPALLNHTDMAVLMQRLYPAALTRQGVGGEAVLRLWLDERGRVVRSRVSRSSGQAALDSVALAVSDSMRFRPARSGPAGVRVIVLIPVSFTVPDTVSGATGSRAGPAVARRGGR